MKINLRWNYPIIRERGAERVLVRNPEFKNLKS
jgi:hypothetical protein